MTRRYNRRFFYLLTFVKKWLEVRSAKLDFSTWPRLLQILCACCTTSFQRYGKKISEIENVVIREFKILIFCCIDSLFFRKLAYARQEKHLNRKSSTNSAWRGSFPRMISTVKSVRKYPLASSTSQPLIITAVAGRTASILWSFSRYC